MNIKVKTALRVILIGTTVLPLIIVALVAAFQIFGFANTMIGDEAATSGAALSSGITNITSSYIDDAEALAKMDFVNTSIKNLNSVKSDLDNVIGAMKSDRNVLDIAVTDSEGMIIYDSKGSSAGTTFFAYNDKWSNSRESFVSKFYKNEATYGSNLFVATAPLTGNDGGYVSVVVDTSEITDYLKKAQFLTYGTLVVADADSVLNYNGSDITSSSELSGVISPDLTKMLASKTGDSGERIEAGTYLGNYGNIAGTEWVWIALYPASQTSSSVMLVFIIGLVIIVALALVCILVAIIASQKVIDPMLNMLKTMKGINEGNHSERINTNGMGKEFANMSDVFNDMMDQSLLSEELHRTVTEISDNMLFEWDFAKESMYVSDNFKNKIELDVTGATLSNGRFLDSLMEDEEAEKYKRDMTTLFKNKDDVGGEYKIKNKGTEMWVSMRAHCITDRLGEVLRVVGVLTDITSEKNATLKLAERASFDFLSQLYNRNTFEREFASELERNVGKKVAALFIDVDDFKFINDRYSHAVGDEVIRFVADTIKKRTGETGFAGRFGGDEFVLCVSDPNLVENVEVLSMDIIDDLYAGYYSKSVDTTLNIKASIGIAIYPDHSTDGKELVGCADAAMYFVKKNGKANYHIYVPEDSTLEGNFTSSL